MKFPITIKPLLHAAIGVLALGLGSTSVFAGTATATFQVSANVQSTCVISVTSAAFGAYTGLVVTTQATVTVTCSTGTAYNIGLDAGQAPSATVTSRSMVGPASALLNYGLFQDSAHGTNWGNTVGDDTVAGTGTGSAQSLTIYGQVPAGQFKSAGPYLDTITATVTF